MKITQMAYYNCCLVFQFNFHESIFIQYIISQEGFINLELISESEVLNIAFTE